MIQEINPDNPNSRYIKRTARILESGGIICYPCDTTYAIGCDIFNKKSVEKLYAIKKDDIHKLFSCILYDFSELSKYAKISNNAYSTMKRVLPGPYTFLLKGTTILPKITLTKRKTIGVRMPDNRICQAISTEFGGPILSAGIQLNNETILNDPYEINSKLGHQLDIVIDGGPVIYNPSTIIDFTSDFPEIIRKGAGEISIF